MVFSLNALFATVASIAYVKNASINYGVFGVVIAGMTLGGVYNALFPFGNKSKKYAILPKNFRFKTNSYPEHLIRAFLGALLALQAFKLYTSGSIH